MNTKLENLRTQLSYFRRTLHLIWEAARGWTLAWVILLVIQGLLPAAIVYLTRLLVDSLVTTLHAGGSWVGIRPTLFLAALMAGVMLLMEIIRSVLSWVRTAQAELIRDHLSALIHEKSVAVDLAFYESPDYHDRLDRARNDLNHRPLTLLENAGSLLQNTITLVAICTLLIPYGIWLPFVLLGSTLPALFIVLHFNRRYHHWWERITADRRRTQYYDIILSHSTTAPELRLFDLGCHFQSLYKTVRRRLRNEQIKLTKDQSIARLGAGLVGMVISGLAMMWMVWQALQGLVTLGDLALFYQALNRGQSLLRSLLENFGQIYADTLFLGNLFDFLELRPQIADPPRPVPAPSMLKKAVHFHMVSFRYPGSEHLALQEFNLRIRAGQIVSIVGPNGAGKSTLIKLLCRLYDPQCGSILMDGIDIRDLSLHELRRMITVLFQWPVPYQDTAAQNIALGDISSQPALAEIEAAARVAGAHEIIAKLPQGYDTPLGKWFANGTELSVGEWQRLALARAFLRRAQIMILDEPTSNLDSWSEADWFDRFRALVDGRTAIIITHRLTIARRADIINVMDSGKIVESGTHNDLLDWGGLYANSWYTQVQHKSSPGESPDLKIVANEKILA